MKEKYNIGIGTLRVILSFLVIVIHFFNKKTTSNYFLLFITNNLKYVVATFYLISFYFMGNTLMDINKRKIKQRFIRLLIPSIIWPIIIYFLNYYISIKINKHFRNSFHDLIIQLLFGSNYLSPLWFLYDLIFFTIIFVFIVNYFKNQHLIILNSLSFLCYLFEFSGQYSIFLSKFGIKEIRSLFQITVQFPFAVLGFTIFSLKLVPKLKKHIFKTLYFSLLVLFIISKYQFFTQQSKDYSLKYFVGCPLIFFIFILLPTEFLKKNDLVFSLVKETQSYTMGIIITHLQITRYINNNIFNFNFNKIKRGNFIGCLFIYIICYCLSFVCYKFFNKNKLKYLFI